MKLLFLIPRLDPGGAERQLVLLANGLARRGHEVTVAALSPGGALEQDLRGVRLTDLGKRGRRDIPRTLAALVRLVRRERPDILHGYLGTANILAALAGLFLPGPRLVFGVRASDMDLADLGFAERLAYRLERLLSRRADLIIVNSRAGRDHAAACGFPSERLAVVPNAVDPAAFRPDPEARARMRALWDVREGQPLVGLVGRMDPMKDQLGFVRAAALLAARRPEARFVLVGGGREGYAARVRAAVRELGLEDRIRLEGPRPDMPAVYPALDVLCLASAYGEGFPNAAAEAMACGVPCVVTDVGDAALVVGASGMVAPPRDPSALAAALEAMLGRIEREGPAASRLARERAAAFTTEALAERTEKVLAAMLERPRRG